MNHAHQNLCSTTQSPELTTKNTFSYVNSTSVNRVVSEQAFVIPPTKEFTCYASADAICTTSCSVGLSTSTQVTYSTYNKGVVSSHIIQTGEFKSPSNTHHIDRYSGDRITGEHGSNRSYAYTGVFDESNDTNRYADYGYHRDEGACGYNYDWDHTGLGSGNFHERTHSSDVENITYSSPRRTSLHDYRDRNESNYESLYTFGTSNSKSHKLQTEVKALIIRRIHTHTDRIQAILKRARPILTMIQAIGVFDSATRPMTFKINGHTAIKVHKVHPLIRVL